MLIENFRCNYWGGGGERVCGLANLDKNFMRIADLNKNFGGYADQVNLIDADFGKNSADYGFKA